MVVAARLAMCVPDVSAAYIAKSLWSGDGDGGLIAGFFAHARRRTPTGCGGTYYVAKACRIGNCDFELLWDRGRGAPVVCDTD